MKQTLAQLKKLNYLHINRNDEANLIMRPCSIHRIISCIVTIIPLTKANCVIAKNIDKTQIGKTKMSG